MLKPWNGRGFNIIVLAMTSSPVLICFKKDINWILK